MKIFLSLDKASVKGIFSELSLEKRRNKI